MQESGMLCIAAARFLTYDCQLISTNSQVHETCQRSAVVLTRSSEKRGAVHVAEPPTLSAVSLSVSLRCAHVVHAAFRTVFIAELRRHHRHDSPRRHVCTGYMDLMGVHLGRNVANLHMCGICCHETGCRIFSLLHYKPEHPRAPPSDNLAPLRTTPACDGGRQPVTSPLRGQWPMHRRDVI